MTVVFDSCWHSLLHFCASQTPCGYFLSLVLLYWYPLHLLQPLSQAKIFHSYLCVILRKKKRTYISYLAWVYCNLFRQGCTHRRLLARYSQINKMFCFLLLLHDPWKKGHGVRAISLCSVKCISDSTLPYTNGRKYLLVLHHLTYSIPLLQQFVCRFTHLKFKKQNINDIKVIFRE